MNRKVQLGFGKKGGYKDLWEHGIPAIVEAYFTGLKVYGDQKVRLLDESGNVIAQKRGW